MYEESERVIRERIEATRERLGETIEEIGERVNPDRVQRELKTRARHQVDEMKANVKRKARNTMRDVEDGVTDTGRGMWERIRENPIPAGMVGVGLAWLMANGNGGSHRGRGLNRSLHRDAYPREDLTVYGGAAPIGETYRTSGDYAAGYGMSTEPGRAGQAADAVREKGHEAADAVREKGHEAADQVREKGHEMADRAREKGHEAVDRVREKSSELKHRAEEGMDDVRERTRQWGHEAQYRARRVEHRIEDSVQENPIAAGAIAAALGFAAGMMIPESRKENEMFGPTRDRLMNRAQSTVRRAGEKAKDVARETAGQTAKRAVDEVMHSSGRSGGSQGAGRTATGDQGDGSPGVSEPGR